MIEVIETNSKSSKLTIAHNRVSLKYESGLWECSKRLMYEFAEKLTEILQTPDMITRRGHFNCGDGYMTITMGIQTKNKGVLDKQTFKYDGEVVEKLN